MPFENETDSATREAATTRVLQRRMTNPSDRNVLRVVAEEFGVREQSLREWVADATPWSDEPAPKKRRPRFSPVVRTSIAPRAVPDDDVADESVETAVDTPEPQDRVVEPDVVPEPQPERVEPAAAVPVVGVAELEAEAAALRRDIDVLKGAMRVILGD